MSHDFREPINTLVFYIEEVSEHHIVKHNAGNAKNARKVAQSLSSLETRFQNFYEAFKKTRNTLKFQKELNGPIKRLINSISTRWEELYEQVHYLRFEQEYMEGLFITDVHSIIEGLAQRHNALMRYLDVGDHPERISTDLKLQVQLVLRDLSSLFDREGVSRDAVLVHGNCYDRFDRVLIGLVFQNLISNSIKYRVKEKDLQIHIGLFSLDGNDLNYHSAQLGLKEKLDDTTQYNLIVYQDNGLGIPPSYIQLVFDPYFQLKRDNLLRDGGSGMGLAIVENVVGIHSGQIFLTSEEEVGTRFCIVMPAIGHTFAESNRLPLFRFLGQIEELKKK